MPLSVFNPQPSDPPPHVPAAFAYRTVAMIAIALALVLLVVIFWMASTGFFLIFAALLIAAIFCGLANVVRKLGVPRPIALLIVYLLAFALVVGPPALGGFALVQQFNELLSGVRGQAEEFLSWLSGMGLPVETEVNTENLEQMVPEGFASSAGQALFGALGAIGNVFIVLFLAMFVSWQPGLYRDGVVSLFPREKRARLKDVLEKSAHSLIMWVAGDAMSMVLIFTVSWIGLWLIGVNNAFLLALQAGLLAFVPTVGAVVAGAIIVLAAAAQGFDYALWALGLYLVIQGIESNVAQPVAQRYTTSLPPALTLGMQLIFGLLFGLLGVVLAVPIVAVAKTLVEELYIEDTLGGATEASD